MKVLFGLTLFALCTIHTYAEESSIISPQLQTVISRLGNLLKGVNLAEIVPSLIKNANQPDQYLNVPQLIEKYGYPVEIHTVTTGDGYILEMHRIPYSSKSPAASGKPVAVLQHGLLSSSADWIILGPTKSLAYLLADAGYDVWMGNARGNTYSKKHVTLSPSDPKFWDFSWHEMGVFDLPAVLDYVLTITSQKDLYYVGHSMGTSMFYVFASSLPQYNVKIRLMTSLAPIAFMGFVTSPFSDLFAWNPLLYPAASILGIRELLPSSNLLTTVVNSICTEQSIIQQICNTPLFSIGGFDSDQVNSTLLPVLLSHAPAGSSAKAAQHYGQEITSGHFRQYDYGLIGNKVRYGRFSPPDYNLTAISAPVRLMYGLNDWFADPTDVLKLNQTLPNAVGLYRVDYPSFNHFDFLWAKDIKPLLNDEIIQFLKKY